MRETMSKPTLATRLTKFNEFYRALNVPEVA